MVDESKTAGPAWFQNPVYPKSFPDPYVLKYCGEYFAYCTGHWTDGRVFGVLRSRDLVDWTGIGGAMQPLNNDAPFYWAPEVTYHNGKFYLYYSVGNEVLMELRVAVSDRPDGGFVDAGRKLTTEDFAIDAHVFTDDDGQRYMFYATDFLEHTHIGTGTVVDRMIDWFTLAGEPRPVTRAKYDWQVYDPARKEKGGVRWHTVEGAFVLKRKGLYYEMFSGGNWQNTTYGVSFAVTDDLSARQEWEQFSDGDKILPIMRTLPGKVVGPGHNSVVRGPDNRELYCVYHSWSDQGRVLAIDRMDFAGERIFVNGPTYTPQPRPFLPTVHEFFADAQISDRWAVDGNWSVRDGAAVSDENGSSRLTMRHKADMFHLEAALQGASDVGTFGIALASASGYELTVQLTSGSSGVVVRDAGGGIASFDVSGLDVRAVHTLGLTVDRERLDLRLDDLVLARGLRAREPLTGVSVFSNNTKAAVRSVALTEGFEDLFDEPVEAADLGWHSSGGVVEIRDKELRLAFQNAGRAMIAKGGPNHDYNFSANIRVESAGLDARWGFVFHGADDEVLTEILFGSTDARYFLTSADGSVNLELPSGFDPRDCRQFSWLCIAGVAAVSMEDVPLGRIPIGHGPTRIGLFCSGTEIAVEMARLTVLPLEPKHVHPPAENILLK